MKKLFYVPSLLLLLGLSANAQVGIGTTTPNASAALDITSTTQGLLPPRMTQAQRNAIATPVQGLMVYCANCGPNGEAQLYNGTAWVNLMGGAAASPYPENSVFCASGATAIVEVTNPTTAKIWMNRNLGATQVATSSTDANAYGDLYQWGRRSDGHQCRTSATTATQSSVDQPADSNFILSGGDWRNPKNDNLWQGVNGVNNPCPFGYRIPTAAEWDSERLSWSSQNSAGALNSPLKLTVAGIRLSNGSINTAQGSYWSSNVSAANSTYLRIMSGFNPANIPTIRSEGLSVRCLKN